RIVAACMRVGALEAGFTVEPWPTMRRTLDESEGTKKTSNAQRRTSNPELRAIPCFVRHSTFVIRHCAAGIGRFPPSSLSCFLMRFRIYKNTDLRVSEVGFGLWTISTGWWGQFTEGEAIALMHKAFDLGITLYDAADTYGNGLSEELIAKAFPKQRDEIVIATKVGYDFVTHGESRGRGQR